MSISLFAIVICGSGYYYRAAIQNYIYRNFTEIECTIKDDAIESNVVADKIVVSFRNGPHSYEQFGKIIESSSEITFKDIQDLFAKKYVSGMNVRQVVIVFSFGMPDSLLGFKDVVHTFEVIIHNNLLYKLKNDKNEDLITLIKMGYGISDGSVRLNVIPDSINLLIKDNTGNSKELATLENQQNISMAPILTRLSQFLPTNSENQWKEVILCFKFAEQTIECPFQISNYTSDNDSYELSNKSGYSETFQRINNAN